MTNKTHLRQLIPERKLATFAEHAARQTAQTASQTIEIMNADFQLAFHARVYPDMTQHEAANRYFKDLQGSIMFASH
jgi:predicted house-cleaning NTP pyrophosphatase (Maf/HAM1 superfamily)